MTMSLIQTVTVGSGGAASIEFTSIPQDGTDLLLLVSGRAATDASSQTRLTFNSDTGSNYNYLQLRGTGSAVSSFTATSAANFNMTSFLTDFDYTANTFANSSIYVSNYTSTVAKSVSFDFVQENNATASNSHLSAGRYTGTSAITSLTMVLAAGNFAQHTVASLYKITKGSDGIVTTS